CCFFFQAEDGIRDRNVTGVQTCALPICYKGVKELMIYAKGVSAKTNVFDDKGNEREIDYARLMDIVKAANYRGYVGIEFEGSEVSEIEGIKLSKKLLERWF